MKLHSVFVDNQRIVPPHSSGVYLSEKSAKKIIKKYHLKNAVIEDVVVVIERGVYFLGKPPVIDTAHKNQVRLFEGDNK